MTDADPSATTDPAPSPRDPTAERRAEKERKLGETLRANAEARQQERAALRAAKATVEPDKELAQLATKARATCGCAGCGSREREVARGARQISGMAGRPGGCVVGVVMATLIARAEGAKTVQP